MVWWWCLGLTRILNFVSLSLVGVDSEVDVAYDSIVSHSECSDSIKVESNLVGEKPFNTWLKNESSKSCEMFQEKVSQTYSCVMAESLWIWFTVFSW